MTTAKYPPRHFDKPSTRSVPVLNANGDVAGTELPEIGPPRTFDPRWPSALAAVAANRLTYARVAQGGLITGIRLEVGTSSGNISVAVYSPTGSGAAGAPGVRKSTSGSVACPSAGVVTVALPAAVQVEPGDFFALTCDNGTATFRRVTVSGAFYPHSLYGQMASAHPAPTTIVPADTGGTILMIGV